MKKCMLLSNRKTLFWFLRFSFVCCCQCFCNIHTYIGTEHTMGLTAARFQFVLVWISARIQLYSALNSHSLSLFTANSIVHKRSFSSKYIWRCDAYMFVLILLLSLCKWLLYVFVCEFLCCCFFRLHVLVGSCLQLIYSAVTLYAYFKNNVMWCCFFFSQAIFYVWDLKFIRQQNWKKINVFDEILFASHKLRHWRERRQFQ